MKKTLVLTLSFLLIFTNISFADTNMVTKSIKDLEMVNNNIDIMIKSILSNDAIDKEDIFKQVAFNESILAGNSNTFSNLYAKEKDFKLKRSYSSILYINSLYELALSSLLIYLNDENNLDAFLDSSASLVNGNALLLQLKSYNNQ